MFEILDEERFVGAVLDAPEALHCAVAGDFERRLWPESMDEARERPMIDRIEARMDETVAFRLDDRSRGAIRELLLKDVHEERSCVLHWWVYSDERLLTSCYDWSSGPNVAHLALSELLDALHGDGTVKLSGFTDFTDEWFDEIERDSEF